MGNIKTDKKLLGRREFIGGLSTLTIAGNMERLMVNDALKLPNIGQADEQIRLGLIGFGFRGEQLARALGYATEEWIQMQKSNAEENNRNTALKDFYDLDDLGIEMVGVCDVYSVRRYRGEQVFKGKAKGYTDYRELLNDKSIDGVIIATPDHWHAAMAMEAAKAGKHVYLEKCMTRTAEESVQLRQIIGEEGITFQLGHQGRQSDINQRARQLIDQGTLGKISLVETTTNRNNQFGAWQWPVEEAGDEKSIDWRLFEGPAEHKRPFEAERFFRWRCWYDYGTGMAGDLLTHEYDAINSIMNIGIPNSAIASGGIYQYNDGRDVPDVFQANFEYTDKKLSLIYSGTLANGTPRGTLIMGTDATLELGQSLRVWAESESTKYKNRIEAGIIDPSKPMVNYSRENLEIDGLTSATSKYFADRGLMYTYQGGKRYDATHLHLADWLNCIRKGKKPS
jgi:predicted dehydrogenase